MTQDPRLTYTLSAPACDLCLTIISRDSRLGNHDQAFCDTCDRVTHFTLRPDWKGTL